MRLHRTLGILLASLLLVISAIVPTRTGSLAVPTVSAQAGPVQTQVVQTNVMQTDVVQTVYIAGKAYPGSLAQMVNDYATLQVRPVLETLGLGVVWSPEDGSTTVVGSPASPVVIRPGDRMITLKDRAVTLPIAPYFHEGRLHAPLDLFRALGIRSEWVSATREIELTPPPYNQVGEFGPPGAGPATFAGLGKDSSGRLYLAVADGPRAGIWRSSDHGLTWEELSEGIGPVARARFIAGSKGAVYLIPDGAFGMWRLDESARQWVPVDAKLQENHVIEAVVDQEGALWFVAGISRIYDAFPAGVYRYEPRAEFPELGGIVDFWLTADGTLWAAGTKAGLHRLNGESWEHVLLDLPDRRAYQVVSSPTDPNWMWALAGGTVMASQDGGQTWQDTSPPTNRERWEEMKLLPGSGTELFLLTGAGGVLYSPTGGGQWFRLTGYWPDATVLDAVMDGERLFLATTSGGAIIPRRIPQPQAAQLSRFAPRAAHWGPNLAEGHQGAGSLWLDPRQSDSAYAWLTLNGESGLYRTEDGGAHWHELPKPPAALDHSWWRFFPHPTQSGHYGLLNPEGIWVTKDAGVTWSHLPYKQAPTSPLGGLTLLESGRILGVMVSRHGSDLLLFDATGTPKQVDMGAYVQIVGPVVNPTQPRQVYLCLTYEDDRCLLSNDEGESWEKLPGLPPLDDRPRLYWSSGDPAELMVGRWVSRDSGRTWQEMPFFQPGDRVIHLTVHPTNPLFRAAVVETDRGHQLLVSRDGGQNWTPRGRPPGATWVHAALFDGQDRLWLGTDAGIWRLGAKDW